MNWFVFVLCIQVLCTLLNIIYCCVFLGHFLYLSQTYSWKCREKSFFGYWLVFLAVTMRIFMILIFEDKRLNNPTTLKILSLSLYLTFLTRRVIYLNFNLIFLLFLKLWREMCLLSTLYLVIDLVLPCLHGLPLKFVGDVLA